MVDLLEELEEMGEIDEENFIYLDEHGKAELKQELIFKWSGFPSKKIHLACSSADSISYIKTLLYVSMEKYSIFLTLKNLRIINLANSKELLPEKGSIGEYIRSDSTFTFDLDSSDMWLETQIDYREIGSVIFFEVKVAKEISILMMKSFIVEVLNNILQAQAIGFAYNVEDICVQRIKLAEDMILATDLRSSMMSQLSKVQKFKELEDENCVKDVFTYISRYLLCVLPVNKIAQDNKRRKSAIMEAFNPTVMHVLENASFRFQVRSPRIEAKIVLKHQKQPSDFSRTPEAQNSQVCNCRVI